MTEKLIQNLCNELVQIQELQINSAKKLLFQIVFLQEQQQQHEWNILLVVFVFQPITKTPVELSSL